MKHSIDFEASDPCLLTMEIVDLYNWLSEINVNDKIDINIKFMEPNISLLFKENVLSFILRYAFDSLGRFGEIYKMDFEINKDLIFILSKEVEEWTHKFPKRLDPR